MPTPEVPVQGEEADASTGGIAQKELHDAWNIANGINSLLPINTAGELEITAGCAGTE